ncbi:MAG TPA: DUF2303 family protein [Nocardioidaceae bacterium]|nr:DUF2303 family protein [Nocardioidaceae bacterium]
MTTTDLTPGVSNGDAQTIVDAALAAAEPKPLGPNRFHVVTAPAGATVRLIDTDVELDEFAERPRRKSGTYAVHDADSFVGYLEKHGLGQHTTEVWADVTKARVVGVINAHLGTTGDGIEDYAGWADHRVTYDVAYTDAWKAWAKFDGQLLSQSDFAEHIEERAIDIISPSAAEMLELAQHFQATTGVTYESSKLLSSGERQFEYKETIDAKAGKRGQLEIPKEFQLALTPFEGADPYRIVARFRYRLDNGVLRIGYRLERPSDLLRDAFLGVVAKIEENVEAPVYRGVSA